MEDGLRHSVFLPDHSLRCQSEEYVTKRRNQQEIHPQHRTHLQAHLSPPSTTRRHVENHPPSLTKHPTLRPQYAGRGWRLFHVRPWMEDGLRYSVFLPDHSLRRRRLKSTRRRGGIKGKRWSTIENTHTRQKRTCTSGNHYIESRYYYQHHL